MQEPPKLPGLRIAPGLCITPGKQVTRHLSRALTAAIHALFCKTILDYTTTIRSGRRTGAGSTSYEADPPLVKWTCGAYRRKGEKQNNSHISTLILLTRHRSTRGRFCS